MYIYYISYVFLKDKFSSCSHLRGQLNYTQFVSCYSTDLYRWRNERCKCVSVHYHHAARTRGESIYLVLHPCQIRPVPQRLHLVQRLPVFQHFPGTENISIYFSSFSICFLLMGSYTWRVCFSSDTTIFFSYLFEISRSPKIPSHPRNARLRQYFNKFHENYNVKFFHTAQFVSEMISYFIKFMNNSPALKFPYW